MTFLEAIPNNPYALSAAISVSGREGKWANAVDLCRSIPSPDRIMIRATLVALSKARKGREAEDILVNGVNGVFSYDNYSLNLVLIAYRNDWLSAERVILAAKVRMFRENKTHPDLHAYLSVVRACSDAKEFDAAFKYLREASALPIATAVSSQRRNELLRSIRDMLWRQWSQTKLGEMKEFVEREASSGSLSPVDHSSTRELLAALGEAADNGRMPSFQSAGARLYFSREFIERHFYTCKRINVLKQDRIYG